jgi:hypothetical protein
VKNIDELTCSTWRCDGRRHLQDIAEVLKPGIRKATSSHSPPSGSTKWAVTASVDQFDFRRALQPASA